MRMRRLLAFTFGAASVVLAPPPAIGQDGGAPVLPPVVGPEVNVSSSGYGTTPIITGGSATCGDSRCLVTWNSYNNGHAMPVDSEGRPVRQAALLLDGFVGRRPSAFLGDDFVVGTYLGGDLTLVRMSADGVPAGTVKLTLTSSYVGDPALAWNGSRLLVLYREQVTPDTANVYTLVLDGNLAVVAGPTLFVPDPSGDAPSDVVVRTGAEFVLLSNAHAWAMNGAGQIVLGPVAIPTQSGLAFGAISAGGVPVLMTTFPALLMRLGADLRPAAMASPPSGAGALAWNGTHILIVSSDSSYLYTRRYNLDLGAADATATSIPIPLNTYAFAGGRGSEYMLFQAEINYVPSEYGIFSRPLNAGGRPRTTTNTLVSVAALRHWLPFLVAQPSGYLAFAAQGEMEVGVMPLGSDGRPVADRPATGLITGRTPLPVALGTSPAGGIAVAGMFSEFRTSATRFDGVGRVLDNPPLETRVEARYRGGIVWNGSSYFLLAGDRTATVGADGSIGSFFNYFFPAGSTLSAVDIMGTTPLCAFINYRPELSSVELAAMRFDQAGTPIDAQPISLTPAPAGTATATAVSLAHDGTRYLAAMDPAVLEANGALTSEVRVLRIGTNAQAADASSTLLRRATGAPPTVSGAAPIPAISNPTAVYDGRMYWVVWREQGLWVRRVGTDARVLDSQPIKLLNEPFEEFALASQGSGAVLLAYSRLDEAPDVQAVRLKARLITTGDTTGAGGAGGRGGAGGGSGAGGMSGRGGASGTTGGGGGSGIGGRGGTGGATGAAGRGGASGAAGNGAAGAAAGSGASGSGGAGGGGGTTGVGGAGGGAAGGDAGGATGGSSGSSGAAGTSGSGGANSGSGSAGLSGTAGTSGAAGANAGSGGVGGATSGSSGCGCETAAANDRSAIFGVWLLVAAGLRRRRSTRRAARVPRAGAR